MVPVVRIISGGQTGADRGGLDAAIDLGLLHGGWCPKGRRAEDGPIPERYRLNELASSAYSDRTEKNAEEADGTVVFTFGAPASGSALTIDCARKHRKPWIHIDLAVHTVEGAVTVLRDWLGQKNIAILNVAGSRESRSPGIAGLVRQIVKGALST
jgi:hypothetical protein